MARATIRLSTPQEPNRLRSPSRPGPKSQEPKPEGEQPCCSPRPLAAEYNRDELRGTALTRLNDLYSRCIRAGGEGIGPNLAKALDVQRELNRLTGLYRQPSLAAMDSGGGEAAEELEAVGEYLLPLALTSESYPLREHARLAAQRIAELEAVAAQGGLPSGASAKEGAA
jgi:hypothetical protein